MPDSFNHLVLRICTSARENSFFVAAVNTNTSHCESHSQIIQPSFLLDNHLEANHGFPLTLRKVSVRISYRDRPHLCNEAECVTKQSGCVDKIVTRGQDRFTACLQREQFFPFILLKLQLSEDQ